MSTEYLFHCPNCHYKKSVSESVDRTSIVELEPMICLDCNELMNITIAKIQKGNNRLPVERLCNLCRGTNLKVWTRECPKCGEDLDQGPLVSIKC